MSDFERLTTQLRSDVSRARWLETDAIRSRGNRRKARRAAAGASLAVIVVLAAVAVAVSLGRGGEPRITPIGTPTGTVVPSPSTPPPSESVPVRPAARDVDFLTQTIGFLLTDRPSLMYTTDGGRTWTTLPPLPTDVPVDGTRIMFVTPVTGYLYGPGVLYMTTDGGRNWTRQPGGAFALEDAEGGVLRVSSSSRGCPPGCQFDIMSAPLGSANWQTVKTTQQYWVAADLVGYGRHAMAAMYANFAGGVDAHGELLISADSGRTWTTRPDPCGSGDYAAEQIRTTVDGSTSVLCGSTTASGPPRVITSLDGGVTFSSPHDAPAGTLSFGASAATVLFVCTLEGRSLRLYRSGDDGATWTVVAIAPDTVADGAVAPNRIVFSGPSQGWWLPGYGTAFSTTDGGRTWNPFQVG